MAGVRTNCNSLGYCAVIETKIKPISVNKAWQGRRFKTPDYKAWREQISFMLPPVIEVPEGRMMLMVTFGVSSKLFDMDNGLKPFIDALQEKYGFNDRQIYVGLIAKVDVPKGSEYIKWDLRDLTEFDKFCEVCDW